MTGRKLLVCLALGFSRWVFAAEPIDPATDLFSRARQNILEGRQEDAINKYREIVRNYSKSALAPQAQLQIAELYSRNREYREAFLACQQVIDKFPASELFSDALEIQFTIAERVAVEYRRRRVKGDKSTRGLPDRETASLMFRAILANGLHTPKAPRAQYRLAVTLDEEGNSPEAIVEFNKFLRNYGDHPLADDAAFQTAFVEYRFSRANNRERGSQERARLGFEDFLVRYAASEKAPEARHLLSMLRGWEGEKYIEAADFYKKTGRTESALRTYQDALQHELDAPKAEAVRKSMETLGAKPPAAATPTP